ncbi:MAG: hypothetical protein JSU89_15745 [Myxococcales bacterium]|nr:MAG: hypothetical protein JSU89_15745 [Myxococcales bacterium]
MDIRSFAQSIHAVNLDNGFDPPSWENLPIKLMLATTELDEARAATDGTGVDPLGEEFADVAIRLLDILHTLWRDTWYDRRASKYPAGLCFIPVEVLLWSILHWLCNATEQWRDNNQTDTRISLELALAETFALAHRLQIDLPSEMEQKLAKNMDRGQCHGRARSDG